MKGKGLKPISSLLEKILPRTGDVPVSADQQQRLARCWREQCGVAGRHGQPLLFTSGRLVVFVESAAWGNEIRHRAHSLQAALAGRGVPVRAIEVKVQPDSFTPPRKPAGTPKLSAENAEQIAQVAETIDHPQLKLALHKLAKRGRGDQR